MRSSWLFIAGLSLAACATDTKGPEENVPADDGKEDSFTKPTDHGAIAFAMPAQATLAGSAGYHTWTFSLSGTAQIHAFTTRIAHKATLDTVLYLYKKTPTGTWGSYLARNDDTGSSVLSSVAKSLGAGDYRVLVKGHDAGVKGPFGVEVDCSGAGCTPTPPAGCVFGTFADDFYNGVDMNLLHNKQSFTAPAMVTDPVIAADIIAATHEAGYADVVTLADAFAAVDQSQIDVDHVYDLLGARAFIAIEFGSGDNPYGAIFADRTGVEVAGLHDSDITSCTVTKQTCQLHQNYGDLRGDASWVQVSTRTVTLASQVTGTQATDALAAIRVAYADAANLSAGLADIDQGHLEVRVLAQGTTQVEVYDYGAGDNTYGAIYVAGTTTLAAEIHDGDFYGCTLLQ